MAASGKGKAVNANCDRIAWMGNVDVIMLFSVITARRPARG